jgi:hypothetical protein
MVKEVQAVVEMVLELIFVQLIHPQLEELILVVEVVVDILRQEDQQEDQVSWLREQMQVKELHYQQHQVVQFLM